MIALLRPLTTATTYLRWVNLLLGGVLLLPYVLLGWVFAQGSRTGADAVAVAGLALVALAVAVLIALIPAVRVLEIAAARTLLGVALPDPDPLELRSWPARRRSAGWYLLNLLLGGTVTVATLFVLPTTAGLVALPWRSGPVAFVGLPWPAGRGWAAARAARHRRPRPGHHHAAGRCGPAGAGHRPGLRPPRVGRH